MKKFDRSKEFRKDNEWGTWGEGVMINFIQEHFKNDDKFVSYWYNSSDISNKKSQMKKWDLRFGCYTKLNRINYYDKFEVEVKTDGYGFDTGNLVFEKSCGGKKSGVFATEAKYFVYFLPLFNSNNIYIIKSEKLITLLGEFNTHIVSGGDSGSNTMMYKISKDEFDTKFIEIGGKIVTYSNYIIPSHFEKKKFESRNITYSSDEIKDYGDPFDFGGI